MRSKIPFVLVGFVLSFCIVRVALGDSGSAVPVDAGITAVDASVAVGSGAGSAVAPPVLPDPVAAPGDTLSLLQTLYKGGHLLDLGILVAFFALSYAAKKVSWLQQDHYAVLAAAALGGLALLAVPAAQGTTPSWSMIAGAVVTIVSLAVNPKRAAQA